MTFCWDDVAVFLALMNERTTGRAAAALGCSQPTVVRRIAALESALGLTLFERTSGGVRPSAAALVLLESARRIERAACDFETEASSQRGDSTPTIRLTLLDHFEPLFIPVLRRFRQNCPEVRTELLASDRILDLARGEADIAVRGRALSDDESIVLRQLPDCAWTLYAPADMPAEQRPSNCDDAGAHLLPFPEGAAGRVPAYSRLAVVAAHGRGSIRCSNYNAVRSAIVSGAALAILPVTVGDNDPQLVRCFDPPPEFDLPIYLLGRRSALRRAYVRELFERIYDHFQANPEILTGRA